MEETRSCRILAISGFDWKFSLRQRLDLAGYANDELRFAASGREGLAAAEQARPDLIIYGLFTLDMDGYEFCRQLQWIPALQTVPVLLVGWVSTTVVYPNARRSGASGYLRNAVHSQGLVVARNALLRGETYYPPELPEATASHTTEGREGCSVLAIDDNPSMGEIVHMILGRGRNDEVRYADSGQKGLEAARQHAPDLIICDVMMPGWNGFETFRQIRMTSGLEEVPFLFQTAYARAYETALELDASGCLMSPYRGEELLAARDAALRGEVYLSASEPHHG